MLEEIKFGLIVYSRKPLGEVFVFSHLLWKSSYLLLIKIYVVK